MIHRIHVVLFCALCIAVQQAHAQSMSGDWPQWRGPNRDGISLDKNLLEAWPAEGPKVVWQVDTVGVGYSSLAIQNGRIITQGDLNGVEHVIALSVEDGSTLWAVQPEPVAKRLSEQIASEFKRLDVDADGQVSELEALVQFGWDFNKYDQPVADRPDSVVESRVAAIVKETDANGDKSLSYAEAGRLLRNEFERLDTKDTDADADALAKSRTTAFVKQLDKDNDGQISRVESRRTRLDRLFGRIDERDPTTRQGDNQLTVAEMEKYFLQREAGRDGLISVEELSTRLARTTKGDGVLTKEELQGAYGGYRNGQGDGPRGTPTIEGDRVYCEGGNGDLTCLDVATGKTLWHVNLREDFGGGRPGWGYSESPLIEGQLLLVTPGGKSGTLAALDKSTGELVWQTEATTQGAQYSSPIAVDIGGVRQIVQFARNNVFGVDAKTGEKLWEYGGANNGTANCCTPIVDDDHVFVSSGYGTGSGLVKISKDGSAQKAEEVYFEKKLACHHGGVVKIGEYIYSCSGGTLICMHFKTGSIAWQARGVGKGSLVAADGMLYILSEGNQVGLVEATPEEYREGGRFKIESQGRPSWAHPVVTGGRFYIRNQKSLTAYDVRS